MALNYFQNFIDQGLIRLEMRKAMITRQLLAVIDNEETIVVNSPCDRVKVNGPIIDKLSCLE